MVWFLRNNNEKQQQQRQQHHLRSHSKAIFVKWHSDLHIFLIYFLACLRFNAWLYIWINSMALSLSANGQAWRVKWWNVFGETAMRVQIEFAAVLVGFIKKSSILVRWDYIIACLFVCLFAFLLACLESVNDRLNLFALQVRFLNHFFF